MDYPKLTAQLILDEDKRSRIYIDTVGKVTGGVGRNLTDRGFSEDEIALMLKNDIALAEVGLDDALPWWRSMSDARQNALLNMAFNMGIPRLLGFKKALTAMQSKQWGNAANEMLDSVWSKQVGQRAVRLAKLIREGTF